MWNTFFYQPLLNAVVIVYQQLPFLKLGLSIIILTILLRILLFPFSMSSMKQQEAMKKLQPEINKIKKKYKKDQKKLNEETMKLYSKHKVNPASGCLPLLIQMPVMIALYRVFINFNKSGITGFFGYYQILDPQFRFDHINKLLYSFVTPMHYINFSFFIWDLSVPGVPLAVLAGVLQFIQAKMMMPKSKDDTQKAMGQTALLMPVMIILFSYQLPAALPLYWIASTLVGMVQTILVKRIKHGGFTPNTQARKN